jgi:hypothetical protein
MTQLPAQLVALALLIGGAFFAGRCSVAPPPPDPALARAIDSLEARIDSLEPIAARKDSVAVVTEDRWRTVTKEVRELVPAGLPVPWPVFLRVLETGDTALASCTAARVSCQELRQAEAARGDSLERDRDLWRARARGRLLELAGEGSTDFDGCMSRPTQRCGWMGNGGDSDGLSNGWTRRGDRSDSGSAAISRRHR